MTILKEPDKTLRRLSFALLAAFFLGLFGAPLAPSMAEGLPKSANTLLFQAATDIDLITNVDSTKDVVQPGEANSYTVTVENRGPADATNVDWVVGVESADGISNTGCVAAGGAVCPGAFTISTIDGVESISAVISSLPVDGMVTLTFDTVAKSSDGSHSADSTVSSTTQTDSYPETNDADINISILPKLLSWGVTKSILRYENAGGATVGTPSSGDYVIYQVVVANNGIDDVVGVQMVEEMGVDEGTGAVPTFVSGTGTGISGYERDFYARGTTIETITCTAANGATCPADQTFTGQTLDTGTIVIPFMPGRTRGAVTNPGANPESTVTFEVRALIGQVACSATGGNRTVLNRARLFRGTTPLGENESSILDTPYGPGDSSDNTAEITFDIATPTCPAYDVVTQVTESATQAASGINANGPFEYTVVVSNNGPDPVSNMPFYFGMHYIENSPSSFSAGTTLELEYWQTYWSINNVTCTAAGGGTCPGSEVITGQEDSSGDVGLAPEYWASGSHDLPDVEATIPSLPSGGSVTFTVTGTAGELNTCGRPQGVNVHAHALPDEMGETNIDIPGYVFTTYYLRGSRGWPGTNQTHGSYYGNNGFSLRTPWQTGFTGGTCDPNTYDLSTTFTGPFSDSAGTVPIAGSLPPDTIVYYRVRVSNVDPGPDFLDPRSAATDGLKAALRVIIDPSSPPSWIDFDTETGIGTGIPDYYHPLDQNPGLEADQPPYDTTGIFEYGAEIALPYAAWEEVGVTCSVASGAAECPDGADMTIYSPGGNGVNELGEAGYRRAWDSNTDWNLDTHVPINQYAGDSLHLPANSSLDFIFPYHVPPLAQPCLPGGADVYVQNPSLWVEASVYAAMIPDTVDLSERDNSNNESQLSWQMEIPGCVQTLDIDKRTVVPAAVDVVPADGIVRYEVDLTYPATATSALDVAQFIDLPSLDCGGPSYAPNAPVCATYEIINFVGCSVTSGNAVCPTQLPIGQQLAQDGTLTAIDAGTIDTRWGTPNATNVAGGAAFEAGSSMTIILEAQLSNANSNLEGVENTAAFASDPESSQYGGGMYVEDIELLSVESVDSMVLQKSVSPSAAQKGETVVFTLDIINNGPADGQGAYVTDSVPANLLAANPAGYTNISCVPLTGIPPLAAGPNSANCANIVIVNNGAAGFRIDMTGSWVMNSGYRITFEAIAPNEGISIENTAELVPPVQSATQRFTGVQDSTVNFRTPESLSLGNRVWEDLNGDGVDDGTEPGIDGVTVNLLEDDGITAVTDAGGTALTAVTANGGYYRFDSLAAGDYIVQIPATDFQAGGLLEGRSSTTTGGTEDVDRDDNGIDEPAPATNGILSAAVTVGVASEPTNDDSADDEVAAGLDQTNVAADENYDATVDLGFVRMSLGNRVWDDADGDGTDNSGTEAGIDGIAVALFESDGTTPVTDAGGTALTATTANGGYYRFDGLAPGTYVVEVTAANFGVGQLLEDWSSTVTGGTENVDQDDNGVDDVDPATNGIQSGQVVLAIGGEPTGEASATDEATAGVDQTNVAPDIHYDATVDFGFTQLSLGNRVWQDVNGDGLDDGTEPGVDGVVVNLYEDDGTTLVDTTATANDGYYRFDGLPEGNYIVEIPAAEFGVGEPLEGWVSTTTGGTTENVDEDDNGIDAPSPRTNGLRSAVVQLVAGGEPTNEPSAVDEAGSGADLTNIAPDNGYDATVDFGFVRLSLGNRVWNDVDGDGTDNGGTEAGIDGVTVNLLETDGATAVTDTAGTALTAVTANGGYYRFDGLEPRNYIVQIPNTNFTTGQILEGWSSTTTGGTENVDREDNGVDDPVPATNGILSAAVTVAAGSEPTNDDSADDEVTAGLNQTDVGPDNSYDATVDFGFVRLSIGNRVWNDVDGDGTDNGGTESGIGGVTVNLLQSDGVTPVTDAGGAALTTTTDGNGYYRFDGVTASTYIVAIPATDFQAGGPLADWWSTIDGAGADNNGDQDDDGVDPATPSDLRTDGLQSAQVVLTIGGEPQNEASIGDGGLDQTDAASDPNNNATVDFGLVRLSLGNRVWDDVDGDGTDNGGAEAGFAAVTLNLLAADGATPITDATGAALTTTTDGNGFYRFDNLAPDDYVVQIPATDFQAGAVLADWWSTAPDTTANAAAADDQNDNGIDDTDPATNGILSNVVALGIGTEPTAEASTGEPAAQAGIASDQNEDATVDFGFVRMSLGNRIWIDANGDGTDNGGTEVGAANVTVNLLQSDGVTPVTDSTGANVTTTTDGTGYYRFDNLAPTTYVVQIPADQFDDPTDPLYLHSSTTNDVGGTDGTDENDNGVDDPQPAVNGILSQPVTLTPGQEDHADGEPSALTGPAGTPAEDPNYDATVDMGFIPPMSIGNRVWDDRDGDGTDNGGTEAGLAGVTVNLLESDGVTPVTDGAGTVLTATTDGDGYYRFDGLGADDYIVELPATNFQAGGPLADWWSATTGPVSENVDQDDNGVDDLDPATNGLRSVAVALTLGTENTGDPSNAPVETLDQTDTAADVDYDATVDFGLVQMSIGNRVWVDRDGDGTDNGGAEAGLAGVTVNLLASDGTTPVTDSTGANVTTTTDANGFYRFDGLAPGDYHVAIPAADFQSGGVLENYWSTITDGAEDVDQNDNGANTTNPRVSGVRSSATATLDRGAEPQGEASNAGEVASGLDQTGVASDPNYDATVDFGFVQLSLGNRVWIDADGDGTDNVGAEAGAPGVTVNLLESDGATPVEDALGNPLTTTTDGNGFYRFDGLEPDTYIVEIPADQFDDPADPLYNHTSSATGTVLDTDQDDNGVDEPDLPTNGILSSPVVLEIGNEPQTEPSQGEPVGQVGVAGDPNENATVDLGFVPPMSLGNRIWQDLNGDGLDDGTEPGVDGVIVNLYSATMTNTVLISTTTNADGFYRFDRLAPGDYIVEIPATEFGVGEPLENWFSTNPDAADNAVAADDQNDNGIDDATPFANGIRTATVTLALGVEPVGEASNSPAETLDQTDAALDENYDATIDLGFIRRDWGDLPDASIGAFTYPTGAADDGPRHIISDGTFLGTGVDAELDGQPNGAASGDDGNSPAPIVDDEDGVTFSVPQPNTTMQVTVIASAAGFLNGWIDFDGTGALLPVAYTAVTGGVAPTAGTIADLAIPGAGTYVFDVAVPPNAADDIFSRWRLTTDNPGGALTITGEWPNGEVEDHVVSTLRVDWGDLPDTGVGTGVGNYETTESDNGASHIMDSVTFLGNGVDAEPDGQPNGNATGDDNADSNAPVVFVDDEDGVRFDTTIMPGVDAQVTVTASVAGFLNAWMDFDGNGVLTDASEQIATDLPLNPGANTVTFTPPANVADELYSRFRFSANAAEVTAPTGEAPNGEVEDYVLMSLGDTVFLDNGADGVGTPAGAPDDGIQDTNEIGIAGVTVELYTSDQTPGTDPPIATTTTDGTGNYLFTGLVPDDYVVHIPSGNFADGQPLDDHVSSDDVANNVGEDPDTNANDNDDNGVDPTTPADTLTNGVSSLPITLVLGTEPDTDGNGLNSNLTLDLGFVEYDWADLPDGTSIPTNGYPTTAADDGASHVIVPGAFLGAGVDGELDGQPETSAAGDDATETDDEDGVTFDSPIMPGEDFTVTVTANVAGFLNVWMDFDGDGSLTGASEQIAVDQPLAVGANQFVFTAPGTVTNTLYSRFRFSTDDPLNAMLPTGAWGNGEVEDYVLMSLGNTIWLDNGAGDPTLQNNGVQDVGEDGIRDVIVELYTDAQTPGVDTPIATTTTGPDGDYVFSGLEEGDYVVHLPLENFAPTAVLDGHTSSDDGLNGAGQDPDTDVDDGDDNGVDPVDPVTDGITTLPVTLALGTEPTSEDDDVNTNLTVDLGLIELVSLGNYVWFDQNADGMQGATEPAIGNAVVELLDGTGAPAADADGVAVTPVTTLADGYYNFGNLVPGDYIVQVTPPVGYVPTQSGADSDPDTNPANDDSNGVPVAAGSSVVRSPVVTLTADEEPAGADEGDQGPDLFGLPDDHSNLTVDFGFFQPVSLGNYIWEDRNGDGVQDTGAGEPPIVGAVAELFEADGITRATDVSGSPVPTVTTPISGFYDFTNLVPGSYIVQVTPPNGYAPSPLPVDPDPDTNLDDTDSNGVPTGTDSIVRSPEITLIAGDEPLGEVDGDPNDVPDENSNRTVDFGFAPLLSVGNIVWSDSDADGTRSISETLLADAVVELLDVTGNTGVIDAYGNVVGNVTTDATGVYSFTSLLPGTYSVRVTPPSGFIPSPQPADPNPDTNPTNDDSNGVPTGVGQIVESPQFTLDVGTEPLAEGEDDPAGLPDGNSDQTVDFGFIPLLSVGNYIWDDENRDGLRDTTEPALEGALVELFDSALNPVTDALGNPVVPMTTTAQGYYYFGDLLPGDYIVQVTPPNGYVPTDTAADPDPDTNEANDDSNGLPTGTGLSGDATVQSAVFTLDAATEPVVTDETDQPDPNGLPDSHSNLSIDFGFYQIVSVGNTIWLDEDGNGLQDDSEPPLAGVVIELLDGNGDPATDSNGDPVPPVTTGPDGFYNFGNLDPGEYQLRGTPPAGYGPAPVPTEPDADENPANNDSNGLPIGSGLTGDAVVETEPFTLTVGAEPTGDTTDQEDPYGLDDTNSNLTVDLGFVPLLGIGNLIWSDENADGLQTTGEPAIEGVLVELLGSDAGLVTDAFGDPVEPMTTTTDGFYHFANLLPGEYLVQVTPPAGFSPTDPAAEPDPDANDANDDSNGIPVGADEIVRSTLITLTLGAEPTVSDETDQSDPAGLPDGNSNLSVDFGFIPRLSVGNYVWEDRNGDGMQDADEPALVGAVVELLDADGNTVTDAFGDVVEPITTTVTGFYNFGNLLPGDFQVQVTTPEIFATTQTGDDPDPDTNPDNDDSNGLPGASKNIGVSPVFTLSAGDEPADDMEDLADPFNLPDDHGDMTIDFGFVPLLSLGNYVWEDVDGDGLQDDDEPALVDVVVELLNVDGTPATDYQGQPVASVTTGADGFYNFGDLLPGDYIVRATPPIGYVATQTPDDVDADTNPANNDSNGLRTASGAQSEPITLRSQMEPTLDESDQTDPFGLADLNNNLTVDFGFYQTTGLGDTVWADNNGDGVQDEGEPGIPDVVVKLFNDDGTELDQTTTDPDGRYSFIDLPPGSYYVVFMPPSGYLPSPVDAGDDTLDSDADPTTGRTPSTTLQTGDYDPTLDAGLVPLLSLGSNIWQDTDNDGLQDADESPLAGATVELLTADGDPVRDAMGAEVPAQTTGDDGLYLFSNLLPGDYIVKVTPPDESYVPAKTPADADPDTNAANDDSNGVPVGTSGMAESVVVTLAPGDEPTDEGEEDPSGLPDSHGNLTVDFGFVQPVSVGSIVWDDVDADGVQDADEPGLPGAVVRLLTPEGNPVTDLNGDVVAPVTVGDDGAYNFSNLPAGDYFIEVTPPNGYVESPTAADPDPDSNSANDDSNGVPTGADNVVRSPVFTLLPGGEPTAEGETDPSDTPDVSGDMTVDFGFYRVLSLGNRIWFDDGAGDGIPNNGTIDGSELGVAGVKVNLLDAERNPVLGPDGQPMMTLTDEEGYYLFDGLAPGQYVVHIDPSNFQQGGVLDSFQSSEVTEADPNADGDINDNGLNEGTPTVEGIYSGVITLGYESEPTNEVDDRSGDATNDNSNLTIDFGFYQVSTAIVLNWLSAEYDDESQTVAVRWQTAAEIRTLGFHIHTSQDSNSTGMKQLTNQMILGKGASGGDYSVTLPLSLVSSTLQSDADPTTFYVWLVETEIGGEQIMYGPVRVRPKLIPTVFLPLVTR